MLNSLGIRLLVVSFRSLAKPSLPILATACFTAQATTQAEIIVSESFGGGATVLAGTTADTFASGIAAVGGSNTWNASSAFSANGTYSSGTSDAAYLVMGSYINDTKGTASGFFTLEGTVGLSVGTGADWAALGFFDQDLAGTGNAFYENNSGIGTAMFRRIDSNQADYYGGPGTYAAVNKANYSLGSGNSGSMTFKIELDLTDYNGSTNYGSVSFYRNGNATADTVIEFGGDRDISAIGFSQFGSGAGSIANLTLTQVPEPGSLALISVGIVAITRGRRPGKLVTQRYSK